MPSTLVFRGRRGRLPRGRRRMLTPVRARGLVPLLGALALAGVDAARARAQGVADAAPAAQPLDTAYTRRIHEYLQDPRITTSLVDHLPASATVPTPLKFFGSMPGEPGELRYAKDIHRYLAALAAASPRAKYWSIGTTEEGREQVILAIADSATIARLDEYGAMLAALTDPRKTSEAEARRLIGTAKPIYWITSGIHSPETGGPEMLTELAYRLIVEETPFVQAIRNHVIVFITPVVEVDGREKEVDTYYYGKKTGKPRPPLLYWGKYVQHDNNRDGMGQYLKLTQNIARAFLQWHPTFLHDLHEAQSYLYTSTGTGPYNDWLDPIATNEWWLLAQTEVMEMTKRGVPGVFTYGFYDGWVPNYLFWIANTHNSFGRFYEVQSYGPDTLTLRLPARSTSREWYRANPPLPSIKWGPRNNVNIQESALLIALNKVAQDRELYLENYWLKNKRSVEKGRRGPTFAWVVPAAQRRRVEAADFVNALRHQGVEVHRAGAAASYGGVAVQPGDYIIRADQPYRTLVDMYLAVQNYSPANPLPYDDTGWTMQLMRNVEVHVVRDTAILSAPMTLLAEDARVPGTIQGTGPVLVVDHTTDNTLVTFRFRHANVAMQAAERDFELAGHHFRAGAIIIPAADRSKLEPSIRELGLSAWATSSVPAVKTHALNVPRIGYVHSWTRTQDEGWVRAALDHYGVPYTYFGDTKLREGKLREKYDVIIYPHVGGSPQSMIAGLRGAEPIPYRRTALTPNLGTPDSSADIRGGVGLEGLLELARFVEQGGTLITEGATSTLFPEYGVTSGVTVETPSQLFVRGSILRGVFADANSPILYGYDGKQLPVYFNQGPVLNAGGVPAGFAGFLSGGGSGIPGVGVNITPNADVTQHVSPYDESEKAPRSERPQADEAAEFRNRLRRAGLLAQEASPRVVMQFPSNPNDMLLSGTLVGGQYLANRALVVDAPLGKGHVVMFALRPFWRWQTQGTFFLAFNAILNWDDLDAGKAEPAAQKAAPQR